MAPHSSVFPPVPFDLALAMLASSNEPVLLLDGELTVIAASISFCRAFQLDAAAIQGAVLSSMGEGEWRLPQLTSLLKATASGFAEIRNYEMKLERPGRKTRCLLMNATKLKYVGDENIRLVLAVSDVTDVRHAEKLQGDLVREKEILLQELHHRVANSLQIIASVIMQSARKVQSEETRTHLFDAHQRVMSVASLQKQLAATTLGDVHLGPYLMTLCDSISASMIRDHQQLSLKVEADESVTTADTSVSLGLIVTELAINALKHAFPESRPGTILVSYASSGPNWSLSVTDDGVGMPSQSVKKGLGTSIVAALAKQLGASISVTNASPGTRVSVEHVHVPPLRSQLGSLNT